MANIIESIDEVPRVDEVEDFLKGIQFQGKFGGRFENVEKLKETSDYVEWMCYPEFPPLNPTDESVREDELRFKLEDWDLDFVGPFTYELNEEFKRMYGYRILEVTDIDYDGNVKVRLNLRRAKDEVEKKKKVDEKRREKLDQVEEILDRSKRVDEIRKTLTNLLPGALSVREKKSKDDTTEYLIVVDAYEWLKSNGKTFSQLGKEDRKKESINVRDTLVDALETKGFKVSKKGRPKISFGGSPKLWGFEFFVKNPELKETEPESFKLPPSRMTKIDHRATRKLLKTVVENSGYVVEDMYADKRRKEIRYKAVTDQEKLFDNSIFDDLKDTFENEGYEVIKTDSGKVKKGNKNAGNVWISVSVGYQIGPKKEKEPVEDIKVPTVDEVINFLSDDKLEMYT